MLRVKNRSGNVHDGKAGLPFLRDLWTQLATLLPRGGTVRFRMDGAFFRQDVLQWLAARAAGYANVPRPLLIQCAAVDVDTPHASAEILRTADVVIDVFNSREVREAQCFGTRKTPN